MPFFAGGYTAHAMKPVEYRLEAREDAAIERYGEGTFEAGFVRSLLQKVLKLDEL